MDKGKVLDIREDEIVIQSQEKIIVAAISDLKIGEEVTWCIRPDHVMVLREDHTITKAAAENIFSGKINEVVSKGATYLLFIDGEFDLEIEMPAHAFERLSLGDGRTIKVSLKKSAIHIIKE